MLARSTGLLALLLTLGAFAATDVVSAQTGGKPGKPGNGQSVSPHLDEHRPGAGMPSPGEDDGDVVPPLEGGEDGDGAESDNSGPPRGCPYSPRRLDLVI